MRDDFDERPSSPGRRRDTEIPEPDPVSRQLQQSLETLHPEYSWIAHFQTQHPDYLFLEHNHIPWTGFGGELFESRVALVSTAGVYLQGQKSFSVSPETVTPELLQLKFREKGDPSFRVIPAEADPEDLWIANPYLETSGAEEDINVVFPLDRLRDLEEESFIGAVAARHFSFMGHLPYPEDLEPFQREVVEQLKQDEVDLVLLTPGEILSHQSMVVIQRAIEAAGIPTVSLTLCRDVVERVGAPRAVHCRFPFGFTLGDANDQATHLRILKDALRAVETLEKPGTIADLPYQWSGT